MSLSKSDRRRMILKHCEGSFAPLSPLAKTIPKTSLYREASLMKGEGLLIQKGRKHRTSVQGMKEIEKGCHNQPSGVDSLEKRIPHLVLLPTEEQRAFVALILAAIVARQNEIQDMHHPCFVMYGATMKWKTWTGRYLCELLGLDSEKSIVFLASESGRSVVTRKGYGGVTISQRDLLSMPFVCLDEFHLGDARTRKLCNVYIQGRTKVPSENEVLRVEPVTLITMNPKKKGSVEEATGFEESQIRRSIICNMDAVTIPQLDKPRGEEVLERTRGMGRIRIPSDVVDCSGHRHRIFRLLENCLVDGRMNLVDVDTLVLLCTGMTGFLPHEDAIIQTLRNYLTIVDTLGWVKADWRQELQVFTTMSLPDSSEETQKVPVERLGELSLKEEVLLLIGDNPSSLDHDFKLRKIKEALESSRIEPTELLDFVKDFSPLVKRPQYSKTLLLLLRRLQEEGENPEEVVAYLADKAAEFSLLESAASDLKKDIEAKEEKLEVLKSEIKEHGSSKKNIGNLMRIQEAMNRLNLGPTEVEDAVLTQLDISKLGFDAQTAKLLAVELAQVGVDPKSSVEEISRLVAELRGLKGDLSAKEKEVERERMRAEEWAERRRSEEANAQALEKKARNLQELAEHLRDTLTEMERRASQKEGALRTLEGRIASSLYTEASVKVAISEIANLGDRRNKMREEVRAMEEKKRAILSECQSVVEELETMKAWVEYLKSGKIPSFESGFWRDLEILLNDRYKRGSGPTLPTKLSNERVRKRLIELLKSVTNDPLSPRRTHGY